MATEHVLIPKTKYEQLAKGSNRMDDASIQAEQYFPDERSTDAYQQQQDTNDFPMSDDDFNSDASSEDNPDYDSYDILQGFQPDEFKYLQPILTFMEEDSKTLTWDKHTGEIIFKNKPVKDSNVIELLKDSLTDNLQLVGKMEFYRGLVDLNVKSRYIKHPENKALLIAFVDKVRKGSCKRKVKRLNPSEATNEWIVWK